MDTDCVDIVLAAYNGASYIEEQVRSVQAQTHENWRLLVSDDGSDDGTLDIVRRLANEDGRVRLLRRDKTGRGPAWNFLHALEETNAPYFAFCDQDDAWLPHKLEHELALMGEREAVVPVGTPGLVFSDMTVVDESLDVVSPSLLEVSGKRGIEPSVRNLLNTNVVAGTTLLGNAGLRELVLKGVDTAGEGPFVQMHDWWLAQIAAACGFVAYLPECTVLYRQHGSNAVGAEGISKVKKIKNYLQNRRRFWDNVRQAGSLECLYENDMDDGSRRLVHAFVSIGSQGPLESLRTIFNNRLYKHGLLETVSQIATVTLFRQRSK